MSELRTKRMYKYDDPKLNKEIEDIRQLINKGMTETGEAIAAIPVTTGGSGGGTGDMLKSVYDPNDDGKVNSAIAADTATSATTATTATTASNALAIGGLTIGTIDDGEYLVRSGTDIVSAALAGGGDMLASVYDPGTIAADAFDYNNFINTPSIPTQYTDELAQDAVGTILTDTATIDFVYTDATPTIEASVKAASITEAMQVLADNTTNDVSTTKHGYVPKAPNNTTQFLRADATWNAPGGGTGRVFLNARLWQSRTGAPTFADRGANLRFAGYSFSATTDNNVSIQTMVPNDWASGAITLKIYWANAGTNTGNVIWRVLLHETVAGGDLDATGAEIDTSNAAVAADGTANLLKITTSSISYTPSAAGALIYIITARSGSVGTDTCTSASLFVGVMMEYTKT